MRDYTHLYRDLLSVEGGWDRTWDWFVSAYNDSDRVRRVFDMADAERKQWLVHPEYGYDVAELGLVNPFVSDSRHEAEFIQEFWEQCLLEGNVAARRMCIDATGFLRPHLMFFIKLLFSKGVRRIDVLYSEPQYYAGAHRARFSDGYVDEVRQVAGFEGIAANSDGKDILVIGAGYEADLVAEVAEDKDDARKVVLLGLPSLRADMYQQGALQTRRARDALGESGDEKYFAPAADAFATATVLSEVVSVERARGSVGHVYLSPLATKAQAMGFALFYLGECTDTSTSIIFPFGRSYERETSKGLSRIWCHTVEFAGL